MVLEHAVLDVRPGQAQRFEAAFAEARTLIAAMPGFGGLTLSRCVERGDVSLLLVRWERLGTTPRASAARPSTGAGASCCTTSTTRSAVVEHVTEAQQA